MSQTPSKRQLKTQANYNLVLDTAITLFNERGYGHRAVQRLALSPL